MHTVNIRLETIDSTQSYAKANAAQFSKECITCVTADEQTKGRGSRKRVWVSPPRVNLYATFYFAISRQTLHLSALAHLMALSCAEILLSKGFHPQFKWPNDILLSKKKVAGILCELSFSQEIAEVFLGIGLNVNMSQNDLSAVSQPATSLKEESARTWDCSEILALLQKQFSYNLQRFKKEGFFPFKDGFENLLAQKGETIRCFDGKKEWVGICHSISADGRLNLYLPDGTIRSILSGEIVS